MLFRLALQALVLLEAVNCLPQSPEKRSPGRVIPSGDPVVIDPNGEYIRASFMNDGSIIAGYTAHENGQSILRAVHTTDGAASWQYLGEVFRGDIGTHDIDNAMPLQLPGGRILYAYRNHDREGDDLHYTYFRISISYSDDGGASFKYLSTVAEKVPVAGVASGLWEPFLRIANDGTLQCYYSAENNGDDQDGFMKHSSDSGATWSDWVAVSGGDALSRDGMIGVAPIDGNNLIAVFENTETAFFTVDAVFCHDDGYSWGERTRIYTPRNGGIAGAPQAYNVWGTLVVSFMTNEDIAGTNGYDGAQMKVVTSTDGGRSWSDSVVVGEAASHWPGIFNRDPTHFLALYSKDGLGAVSQLYELVD